MYRRIVTSARRLLSLVEERRRVRGVVPETRPLTRREREILAMLSSGLSTRNLADRLHVSYRLRVIRPGKPWSLVQQHLLCAHDDGRITALDLVCTGFRPEYAATPTRPGAPGKHGEPQPA